MKKLILAYLAGAMDSDGFFTIRCSTYRVRVVKDSHVPGYFERCGIKQVQPEIVDLIHKMFGGYRSIQKPNTKNGKPLYSVELTNLKCNTFVKAILPYLLLKKEQAKILLELREILSQAREDKVIIDQKSPHGKIEKFTKRRISENQLKQKNDLMIKIKSLNDTRDSVFHTPKPWR